MKEKKVFVVEVNSEMMKEVEKSWYEYNASQSIIAFIMQQKDVVWDTLQEYLDVAEHRFIQCEMLKNKVATSCKPEEVDLTKYNYSFNFEDNTITFEED